MCSFSTSLLHSAPVFNQIMLCVWGGASVQIGALECGQHFTLTTCVTSDAKPSVYVLNPDDFMGLTCWDPCIKDGVWSS